MRTNQFLSIALSFIIAAIFALKYFDAKAARARAKLGSYETIVSPNKEYKIRSYYISSGDPMILLFQIFDRGDNLIAEYTRNAWPGAAFNAWICEAGPCTAYIFETGDAEPIRLPPTWLDRLLAKIP